MEFIGGLFWSTRHATVKNIYSFIFSKRSDRDERWHTYVIENLSKNNLTAIIQWLLIIKRQWFNGAVNFYNEENSLKIWPVTDLHVLQPQIKMWDSWKLLYVMIYIAKLENILKYWESCVYWWEEFFLSLQNSIRYKQQ